VAINFSIEQHLVGVVRSDKSQTPSGKGYLQFVKTGVLPDGTCNEIASIGHSCCLPARSMYAIKHHCNVLQTPMFAI